jgi:hypothetical protein
MKNTSLQNKHLSISQLIWKKRFNSKFMPHAGYMGNGGDIHLMQGVNGAGISHLTQLLIQALPDNHYINHPLAKFKPKLTLSTRRDRLAIPYHKDLAPDHPLKRVYRIYAEWNQVDTDRNEPQEGNETSQGALLIMKEVHGLLATEALLRELKCHVLFYVSDPVILADQIFSREGLDTPYLDLESKAVMDPRFLKRFIPYGLRAVLHADKLIKRLSSPRQRRVQRKIFTISLIQRMFHMLAVRYPELATVVDFALIQNDPKRLEFPLANWLGTKSLERSKHVINMATFAPDGQESKRWKRSWPESITNFERLSAEDVDMAYQLNIDDKLIRNEGMNKTRTKRAAV